MDTKPLTLHNVRWPLDRQPITGWWQATLNEALADTFLTETAGHIVVFRTYT